MLKPSRRAVTARFSRSERNDEGNKTYPPVSATSHQAAPPQKLSLCERAVRNAIKGDPRRNQPGLNGRHFSVEKTGRNYVYRFKVSKPAQLAVRRSEFSALDSGTLQQPQRHVVTETPAPSATHPSNPTKTCWGGDPVAAAVGNLSETAWLSVKDILGTRLNLSVRNAWIEKLTVASVTEEECVLSAPTNMIRSYISQHFLDLLEGAWRQTIPTIKTVRLIGRQLGP